MEAPYGGFWPAAGSPRPPRIVSTMVWKRYAGRGANSVTGDDT